MINLNCIIFFKFKSSFQPPKRPIGGGPKKLDEPKKSIFDLSNGLLLKRRKQSQGTIEQIPKNPLKSDENENKQLPKFDDKPIPFRFDEKKLLLALANIVSKVEGLALGFRGCNFGY